MYVYIIKFVSFNSKQPLLLVIKYGLQNDVHRNLISLKAIILFETGQVSYVIPGHLALVIRDKLLPDYDNKRIQGLFL